MVIVLVVFRISVRIEANIITLPREFRRRDNNTLISQTYTGYILINKFLRIKFVSKILLNS